MSKDFLTYDQQMAYLSECKGIVCDPEDKSILIVAGYFNLINGYKKPFVDVVIDNKHHYIKGTTLKQIYALKVFDDSLRSLLLSKITKVEEEVRVLTCYVFDLINLSSPIPWNDVKSYDDKIDIGRIQKLIDDSERQLSLSEQDYVKYYNDHHKFIPTWIMAKAINFSTFIDFLLLSKQSVKESICKLYNIKDNKGFYHFKLLIGSLHWMRKIRNSCAHNERIYTMHRLNGRISTPYLNLLPSSYKRDRDQRIIDLIISLKYFMNSSEYAFFITEIKTLLINLEKEILDQAFQRVRSDLGIKNINDLDYLLNNTKTIEYNSFG